MSRKYIKITSVIIGLLTVVFCGFLIKHLIDKNSMTIIEDIDKYYYAVPNDVLDSIFRRLHETIGYNSDSIPIDQAFIRDSQPFLYSYNQDYNGYMGNFIVDVPSIEQSYKITINFGKDDDKSGVGIATVECLSDESKMIYAQFDCKDYRNFIDGRFR